MSAVFYKSQPEAYQAKEKAYLETRSKEGRLLDDAVLARLPDVPRKDKHWREWRVRKRNLGQFLSYWKERGGPLRILDLGCGNGWMTNHLAQLAHSQVTGMDLNQQELDQAARVFGNAANLRFVYGDIFQDQEMTFDVIILAATFQYFADPKRLIGRLFELLDDQGEIHITETMFYNDDEVEAAKQRSKAYYESLGQPQMADYYHHHRLLEMQALGAETLHDPHIKTSRWKRGKSPFHWLRFRDDSTNATGG